MKTTGPAPIGGLCVRCFANVELLLAESPEFVSTCRSRGLQLDADFQFKNVLKVGVKIFQKTDGLQYSESRRTKTFSPTNAHNKGHNLSCPFPLRCYNALKWKIIGHFCAELNWGPLHKYNVNADWRERSQLNNFVVHTRVVADSDDAIFCFLKYCQMQPMDIFEWRHWIKYLIIKSLHYIHELK